MTTSGAIAQTKQALVGTWKLVSYKVTNDKGVISDAEGPNPTGFLTYTADGRMSVVMGDSRRKAVTTIPPSGDEAAAALRTFNAYAGSYTFTDGKVTHHLEVSLIQNLVNTDQVRSVKIDGDRLTLQGGITVGGVTVENVEVVWERLKPETAGK